MSFGYSKKTDAFYFLDEEVSYRENGQWSGDVIPVTDEIWCEFVREPPPGKQRGADEDGNPCWNNSPPLSDTEYCERRALLKKGLLHEALDEIRKLDVISGITTLTTSDAAKLAEWKSYLQKIYNIRPEDRASTWPERPETDS